jgi:aerobic-type carbon monoxide dehydrogenase small subunit (CoxS/CutS family)
MKVSLELNGRAQELEVMPAENLLTMLRAARQFSVKLGCETGDCGSCTVHLNGEPVNSCVVAAAQAHQQRVTTLEGLLNDPLMNRIQEAMVAESGIQCGYCTPGILMSLYFHFKAEDAWDEHALREALTGNLCRCTGYVKPIAAALSVAKSLSEAGGK